MYNIQRFSWMSNHLCATIRVPIKMCCHGKQAHIKCDSVGHIHTHTLLEASISIPLTLSWNNLSVLRRSRIWFWLDCIRSRRDKPIRLPVSESYTCWLANRTTRKISVTYVTSCDWLNLTDDIRVEMQEKHGKQKDTWVSEDVDT